VKFEADKARLEDLETARRRGSAAVDRGFVEEVEPTLEQRGAWLRAVGDFTAEFCQFHTLPRITWTWYRDGDGPAGAQGYHMPVSSDECLIGIQRGMSADETYKTVIHELHHAIDRGPGDREGRARRAEAMFR
jgi:hypothetical protein